MKRFIAIVFLALMGLSFCGCAMLYSVSDSIIPSKLTRGTIDENVYASSYASLVFTAPEGWSYITNEELAELMDLSAETFNDAGLEFSQAALEKQPLLDMGCKDLTTGTNVLLVYENLALTGHTSISETEYIEYTKRMLEEAQMAQYEFSEITDAELCGQTFIVMQADMVDCGVSQYHYARKIDKYMLCIITTIVGDGDVSEVMGCFTAYEAE